MRKLFASAVFAFALFASPQYFAATPDVPQAQVIRVAQNDQTVQPSAADQAAYADFQTWADAHMLDGVGRAHVSEDGTTIASFDLALGITDADGDEQFKWIVYGYPTVAAAAAQIESDFAAYPDGHQTEYVAPNASEKKA